MNGAIKFLDEISLNLYIGSNSTKERIVEGLNRVKLNKFFKPKQVYSFDLVKNPKPHPDVYLKVIEDNKLNKDETIIIEDSVVGVKAGYSANVKVIGLTAGGHWHENRNEKDLLEAGAIAVTNNYKKIKEIKIECPLIERDWIHINNLSLLYISSSLVSVANSKFGPSTIASTGHDS